MIRLPSSDIYPNGLVINRPPVFIRCVILCAGMGTDFPQQQHVKWGESCFEPYDGMNFYKPFNCVYLEGSDPLFNYKPWVNSGFNYIARTSNIERTIGSVSDPGDWARPLKHLVEQLNNDELTSEAGNVWCELTPEGKRFLGFEDEADDLQVELDLIRQAIARGEVPFESKAVKRRLAFIDKVKLARSFRVDA